MTTLESPVSELHRIGKSQAGKLRRLGIVTAGDLLWHLPQRYEDVSAITPIAKIQPEVLATIRGRVELVKNRRSFRRKMMITEIQIADDSGQLQAIWFRQPYIGKVLKPGDEIFLVGKPKPNLLGLQLVNPVYEKVKDQPIHTASIVPFYQLTEGLSHKQIRFLIKTSLDTIGDIHDELPDNIRRAEKFTLLSRALQQVHFPSSEAELQQAIARLKFEELFWLQLKVAYAKKFYQQQAASRLAFKETEIKEFVDSLPFKLTDDQRRTAWEIIKDLASVTPMNRLLQGDVGSGKTVVAALAMYNTTLNSHQSVLMAPTELLALQHFRELQSLLPKLSVALLTAKQKYIGPTAVSKAGIVKALGRQEIDIVVGTHSLLSEGIGVKNLGLVVVDEQHRFGVAQRQRLTEISRNKKSPHLLSLSATPIPRTLALTLYGDLSISTIRQKPLGRKPIITRLIEEAKRPQAYEFIRQKISQGQLIFVICPLIDESDILGVASVTKEQAKLQNEVFPDLSVRYLHGKMRSEEKKKLLNDFNDGAFPILVTTSVIEVGIDIPSATVMVIEGADRFGLAQLHQLRGRVGRSDAQSYCLLFTGSRSAMTLERLRLVCRESDGFALAEADLKLRGEGEVFGTRQSGIVNFKIAQIHDIDLIKKSHAWVSKVVTDDDDLKFYCSIEAKLKTTGVIHWE